MTLERCLLHLEDAIAAAGELGLDASAARSVSETARARLGYPSDVYVLAIAGGTGVGKSTILNALAGEQVSVASARRPTTAEPVAWVPAARRRELSGLLAWLDVTSIRENAAAWSGALVILDLPDFDSIAAEHRARVDAFLPRVDAVMWVVDPEKYKDEAVHRHLRAYAPRLRHQSVVLNRADLLTPDERRRVADDMREQLRRDGLGELAVTVTQAKAGAPGVADLRAWLEMHVDAKRVVASRVAAEAHDAVRDLSGRAGVGEGRADPLIDPARAKRALISVDRAVLALVDIAGLERQAVAATRLAARSRGAGPLGHLTSAVYRLVGRARASADPASYVRRWRRRGSLAPAIEPLRELVASTLPSVPASIRGTLAALTTSAELERRLADTVERSLAAGTAGLRVPTSGLWSLIGAAQYAVTAVLLFCAFWLAALFAINGAPVGYVDLPYLGPLPTPVMLLATTLLVGYLLAVALRLHAGWLGRRWARGLGRRIADDVRQRIADDLLLPLERSEAARRRLAALSREVQTDCAAGDVSSARAGDRSPLGRATQ